MCNGEQMHFLVAGFFTVVSEAITEVAFDHAHYRLDLLALAIGIVVELCSHFASIFFSRQCFSRATDFGRDHCFYSVVFASKDVIFFAVITGVG